MSAAQRKVLKLAVIVAGVVAVFSVAIGWVYCAVVPGYFPTIKTPAILAVGVACAATVAFGLAKQSLERLLASLVIGLLAGTLVMILSLAIIANVRGL